jgi:hypothetical protein
VKKVPVAPAKTVAVCKPVQPLPKTCEPAKAVPVCKPAEPLPKTCDPVKKPVTCESEKYSDLGAIAHAIARPFHKLAEDIHSREYRTEYRYEPATTKSAEPTTAPKQEAAPLPPAPTPTAPQT